MIIIGDCREKLKDLESESINCCVTSPPYFGLRDYGHKNQIGLEETPGKYESYVDLLPGEWTRVRIVVSGEQAKLFVHGSDQPCLIVNDLKLGADKKGGVGLWVGVGTEAYFSNLTITSQ